MHCRYAQTSETVRMRPSHAITGIVEKAAVGVKSASEVRANAEWLEVASRVPVTLWMDAKAEGLLAEDVPVPG